MPADHSIAILVPSPARPASSGFLQFVLVLLMELKRMGPRSSRFYVSLSHLLAWTTLVDEGSC